MINFSCVNNKFKKKHTFSFSDVLLGRNKRKEEKEEKREDSHMNTKRWWEGWIVRFKCIVLIKTQRVVFTTLSQY